MIEVLRTNSLYQVELDEDTSRAHIPHTSLGKYRVLNLTRPQILFETRNRDKAFGVYEYLSLEAKLLP